MTIINRIYDLPNWTHPFSENRRKQAIVEARARFNQSLESNDLYEQGKPQAETVVANPKYQAK
jgi:hypothetical protein